MAALTPALVRLRSDVNAIAPDRDKASDGWIGNEAHQLVTSSHNDDEVGKVPIRDADTVHEVHAVDIDGDLRQPGLTMEMVVQHVLGRCRSGTERRLRYIIYRRRIWSASNGWREAFYDGDNPHDQHAHFDGSYDTALEADAASWRLEDIPVALTTTDKDWFRAELGRQIDAKVDDIARAVAAVPVDVNPGGDANMQPWSRVDAYGSLERHRIEDKVDEVIERLVVPPVPTAGRSSSS